MKKSEIRKIIANMQIPIPKGTEKELLELYGNSAVDVENGEYEYTEQDICEQLRKKLRLYEKSLGTDVFQLIFPV